MRPKARRVWSASADHDVSCPRGRIVEAARAWIGTPYIHRASVLGAGCDCLGLVRGVWRDLYGKEPEAVPPYGPHWAEWGGAELLRDALARHMPALALAEAGAGDVVLFRLREGGTAAHAAILSGGARMIHALSGRKVAETGLGVWWRRRMALAFRYPFPASGGRKAGKGSEPALSHSELG